MKIERVLSKDFLYRFPGKLYYLAFIEFVKGIDTENRLKYTIETNLCVQSTIS